MTRRRIAIIGAASLGRQMAEHLSDDPDREVAGFLDDAHEPGDEVFGRPVLGRVADIEALYARGAMDALQVGVGERHLGLRARLWARHAAKVPFETFVAPGAHVEPTATLGAGCFVFPGCTLHQRVVLGPLSVLQVGCTIAHDAVFGVGSFCGPGVTAAGFTRIGQGCLLGVGSTLLPEVRMADGSVLAAGAVLTHDAETAGPWVGVPARDRSRAPSGGA